MIFVALGTQKFQFKRLVQMVEDLVREGVIQEQVIVQNGNTEYQSDDLQLVKFLDKHIFDRYVDQCNVLITHSGVGTILSGNSREKPVIVVARLKKYHEHIDDHQMEIAEAFQRKNIVLVANKKEELCDCLREAKTHHFLRYESRRDRVEQEIFNYINNNI